MSRSRALAVSGAILGLALGSPPAPLGAQEVARDTLDTLRLAPVVISARPTSRASRFLSRLGVRSRLDQLERENRQMERLIAVYDRRIEQLEARLAFLKTVVADSLRRDIATMDSATVSLRSRRLALEARAREWEKPGVICARRDTAAVDSAPAGVIKPPLDERDRRTCSTPR